MLGDDWEHEEIFTDDDEDVGNDPEEREELAPEVPASPEIKQVCLHDFCYRKTWDNPAGKLLLLKMYFSKHFLGLKLTYIMQLICFSISELSYMPVGGLEFV